MRHLMPILLAALLWSVGSSAQTPQGTAFTYQGVLKQNGNAINGNTDMVFDLFDAAVGGNQVGPSLPFTSGNGNPVNIVNGVFDVTLDFGPNAFMTPISDQRFLRLTVNGTVLAPRTQIQSEPYALQAQTAELAYSVSNASIGTAQIIATQVQRRVSGNCASGSAIATVNQDGSVGCQTTGQGTITGLTAGRGLSGGGTSGSVSLGISDPLGLFGNDPNGVLFVQSTSTTGAIGIQALISDSGTAVYGNSSATTGSGTGLAGGAKSPAGVAVSGINTATTGAAVGTRGQTASANGLAVAGYAIGSSGANSGVFGETYSATGKGLYGRAADTLGAGLGAGTGVYGESDAGSGVVGMSNSLVGSTAGVAGINTNNGWGVYGSQSVGPGGAGVRGEGAYAGVWGNSDSVYGVLGTSSTGTAMYGLSSASGTGVEGSSQSGYGVFGVTSGASAAGVKGANASGNGVYGSGATGVYGTGTSYGVYADGSTAVYANVAASITNGFGVYAYSHATSGPGNGVYGESDSPSGVGISGYSGSGIGVAGSTVSGLAGKFVGNVSVTGTLSKGGGSFKIDHPLDPENKYLYHSFVESPDMKNIYDGVATLDARGEAWVELPAYFEALNRDFRYQLTALGRAAPALYVADEIAGNRFRIAGGAPGQRVSWQVTGTRHDAFANANRIPVEVVKSAVERGKYLHPAAFGQPASCAIEPFLQRLDKGNTELRSLPVALPAKDQ